MACFRRCHVPLVPHLRLAEYHMNYRNVVQRLAGFAPCPLQSSFDKANTYPGKRMRPTTTKQASRRAEIAVRQHDALQLKIAGYSDRKIPGGLE